MQIFTHLTIDIRTRNQFEIQIFTKDVYRTLVVQTGKTFPFLWIDIGRDKSLNSNKSKPKKNRKDGPGLRGEERTMYALSDE